MSAARDRLAPRGRRRRAGFGPRPADTGPGGPRCPRRHVATNAGLHALPRTAGARDTRGFLSAHRGQACGVPVQPAGELPRWPQTPRRDGASGDAAFERLPARDRDPLCQSRAALSASAADPGSRPAPGARPAIPGLLGLPRDYLVAQLGAWRSGARRASVPDCMADIARALSPEDLTAVAEWLAAQPVPDHGRAVSRLPAPLPVRCGSGA